MKHAMLEKQMTVREIDAKLEELRTKYRAARDAFRASQDPQELRRMETIVAEQRPWKSYRLIALKHETRGLLPRTD